MATITVKTQMEATPALIAGLLQQYAAKTANDQFPFVAGTFVALTPEVIKALQGADGMPGLVISTGKGSPLGIIAVHKIDGDITIAYLSSGQIQGAFTFPAGQVPASS